MIEMSQDLEVEMKELKRFNFAKSADSPDPRLKSSSSEVSGAESSRGKEGQKTRG